MDYYLNKHMPMVAGLLGDTVKGATVEKGLVGGTPGAPAEYAAIGNLYFDSIEAFEKSFGANVDSIMADMPNYTNSEPILQISEVMI
jgi:uncharacterized protein (TIGR02118 family)